MSAIGFAMVAVGAMLVYAGMTGDSLPGALRDVIKGDKGGTGTGTGTAAGTGFGSPSTGGGGAWGTGTATAPSFGNPTTGGGGSWYDDTVPAPVIATGPGAPAPRLGGPQA